VVGRARGGQERAPAAIGLALALALAAGASRAGSLQLTELGDPVPIPGIGNAELSGISWAGGARYFAVDDNRARLFPLEVTLDPASGQIARVEAGEYVKLEGARDSEGVAWRAATGTLLVTDERLHEIREYDPESGKLRRRIPPPVRFRGRLRANRSLESIALSPDGRTAWIANEGPLRLDGPNANALSGAWVRLQRLDAKLAAAGSYAYRTEAGLGFVGVVDLLVAPRGELLVLERALTGGGFSARIFLADLAGATDVTSYEQLRGRDDFQPASKVPLWERRGGFQNFEGLALGPELPGAGRLVLVISDGGDQRPPALVALRLVYAETEPEAP
jgi:hypothetical protein